MMHTVVSTDEWFRSGHNSESATEYWLEHASLMDLRKVAGVEDPSWSPPPGWKASDKLPDGNWQVNRHGLTSVEAAEVKHLNEMVNRLKSDMKILCGSIKVSYLRDLSTSLSISHRITFTEIPTRGEEELESMQGLGIFTGLMRTFPYHCDKTSAGPPRHPPNNRTQTALSSGRHSSFHMWKREEPRRNSNRAATKSSEFNADLEASGEAGTSYKLQLAGDTSFVFILVKKKSARSLRGYFTYERIGDTIQRIVALVTTCVLVAKQTQKYEASMDQKLKHKCLMTEEIVKVNERIDTLVADPTPLSRFLWKSFIGPFGQRPRAEYPRPLTWPYPGGNSTSTMAQGLHS